jgi:hypothetical protein
MVDFVSEIDYIHHQNHLEKCSNSHHDYSSIRVDTTMSAVDHQKQLVQVDKMQYQIVFYNRMMTTNFLE